MKFAVPLTIALAIACALVMRPEQGAAGGATFLVDTTSDADLQACTGAIGDCSLRGAINKANATAGADTINFSYLINTLHVISPDPFLPTITEAVLIDGYFVGGAVENTNPVGEGLNATLRMVLDGGSAAMDASGFNINASGVEIRGFNIRDFGGSGIRDISANGGNTFVGNYIGTDATGAAADGNGIGVSTSSPDDVIGGTAPADRNLISGNAVQGVRISGSGADDNTVQGNIIGLDAAGTADVGNGMQGVWVLDASNAMIGGTESGAGNVISGNGNGGIAIDTNLEKNTSGHVVQGNLVGTDVTGTVDVGNSSNGIQVTPDVLGTQIGGTAPAGRNVVSGNGGLGLYIGFRSNETQIQGNYIGTDITGEADLGNGSWGIGLIAVSDTLIGGITPGAGNVISGNGRSGISVVSVAQANTVQGNFIGTDIDGQQAIPNDEHGIEFRGNTLNTVIGGTSAGARNIISGNTEHGILFWEDGGSGGTNDANTVQGNYIGTNKSGTQALGNADGIRIMDGASSNTIGGPEDGAGNLISGNAGHGITGSGAGVTGNLIEGNSVGTNAAGDGPIPNAISGADFSGPSNEIRRNHIAYNGTVGVTTSGGGIMNTISQNSIHDNGTAGIDNLAGGNLELEPPSIFETGSASGSACPNCLVEVFSDDVDEGRTYHGSAMADGAGSWTFNGAVSGPFVTATATDADGNTSEFSAPFPFTPDPKTPTPTPAEPTATPGTSTPTATPGAGTPTATATPEPKGLRWGDLQCDGDVDPVDGLGDLRDVAGLSPLAQTEPCPDIRTIVDIAKASLHLWGDSDCDNDVDAVDALALLRHVAGLAALNQQEPCPDIGAQIVVKK